MAAVTGNSRLPLAAIAAIATLSLLPMPTAGETAPSPGAGEALEEIVVTARKREETLLAVPMSIAVIPGTQIEQTGLDSLYPLQFAVPGLVVVSQGLWGAGISLRGVTDDGVGSLPVSVALDGVELERSNLALSRLFDVERIEVLKGPQGTLYGRNSTGGSVNIVNRPPAEVFGAGIEAAHGSFDTTRLDAHLNVPFAASALRLAAAAADGDGVIRNTVDDRRFAEDDYAAVRASLRLRPSQRVTVDLMGQHVEDDGATGELWLPRIDHLPDPGDVHLTTVTATDPYLTIRNDIAKVGVVYETDTLTLASVSGHAGSTVRNLDDCAGIPELVSCERGVRPLEYRQWSQELRLASTAGETTDWLVGAFFLTAEEDSRFFTRLPARLSLPLYDYAAETTERATAVYGQATHRIGADIGVTGGLRVSREHARLTSAGDGINDNRVARTEEGDWSDTSWRLGVDWTASEEALVYASVATGFRSGGISPEYLPPGEFDRYDPETMTAWEAGLNLRLPAVDGTLRGSLFYYDYRDMQVRSTVFVANRLRSVVDNAARARIAGLDISGDVAIGERSRLHAGAVWLPRREYVEFTDSLTGADLSGNRLSRAPGLAATVAIDHRRPLGRLGTAWLRAEYSYRSDYFFTKENERWNAQPGFGLLNLYLRLDSPENRAYVFAAARNLGDTDYFHQVFLQSAPGDPRTFEAGAGLRF